MTQRTVRDHEPMAKTCRRRVEHVPDRPKGTGSGCSPRLYRSTMIKARTPLAGVQSIAAAALGTVA